MLPVVTFGNRHETSKTVKKQACNSPNENGAVADAGWPRRTHHDHLRQLVPVMGLETAPEEKDLWNLNDALLSAQ